MLTSGKWTGVQVERGHVGRCVHTPGFAEAVCDIPFAWEVERAGAGLSKTEYTTILINRKKSIDN